MLGRDGGRVGAGEAGVRRGCSGGTVLGEESMLAQTMDACMLQG
jgi:hypothetical protein